MKPFQIILLAAFGIAALLGLALFATFSGGGGKDATGPVAIWGTLPQETMDDFLAELISADKTLAGVTYEEYPLATFDAELANAIAEGGGPDLLLISQEQLHAMQAKLTLIPSSSISERVFIDTYVPLSELFLAVGGTYGVPFLVDPLVLFYNRPMLSDAGFSSPPSTWEAVSALSESFTVRSEAGAVSKSVVPLGDYGNIVNARAILSLLLLQSGTPIVRPSDLGFSAALSGSDGPAAANAVNFFTQFADPAKTVYTWNRTLPLSRDAFVAGDLLLYPGFASERPFLAAANPNLDFDVARMPAPANLSARMTYGLAYAFAVPRASLNPAGALSAAFTLSSQSSVAAPRFSMAPASRASLDAFGDDRYLAVFYPEALIARGWRSPSPILTDGIFAGMIANITTGRRSADEALRSAGDSIEAALQ